MCVFVSRSASHFDGSPWCAALLYSHICIIICTYIYNIYVHTSYIQIFYGRGVVNFKNRFACASLFVVLKISAALKDCQSRTLCISQQCTSCRCVGVSVWQCRVQSNFDTHTLSSHFNLWNRLCSELPLFGACHNCAFSFSQNFLTLKGCWFIFLPINNILLRRLVFMRVLLIFCVNIEAYVCMALHWFIFVLQNKNSIPVIYGNFHKFLKGCNFDLIDVQHFAYSKNKHF